MLCPFSIDGKIKRSGGGFKGEFSVYHKGKLHANILAAFRNLPFEICALKCIAFQNCQSLNYDWSSRACEISGDRYDEDDMLIGDVVKDWIHYDTPDVSLLY